MRECAKEMKMSERFRVTLTEYKMSGGWGAACVADSTKIAVSDSEPSRVVRSFTT